MAHVNTYIEKIELEKLKPKIRKAQIEQAKREKGKIWEPIPGAFGNAKRLKK